MKKEKFHIEYIFDKVSRRSLWNHLTTALGLSAWFADEVIIMIISIPLNGVKRPKRQQ